MRTLAALALATLVFAALLALPVAVGQVGITSIPRGGSRVSDSCASDPVSTLLCREGPNKPVYMELDGEYTKIAEPQTGLGGVVDLDNAVLNATPARPVIIGLRDPVTGQKYGERWMGTDQSSGPFDWCFDQNGARCNWDDVIVQGKPKYYKMQMTDGTVVDYAYRDGTTLALTYLPVLSAM